MRPREKSNENTLGKKAGEITTPPGGDTRLAPAASAGVCNLIRLYNGT